MFKSILQIGALIGAAFFIVPALGAALGFASGLLDAFNHLQPVLFVGTLLSLLIVPALFKSPRVRAFVLSACATGFLASATIVIPEAISALLARDPLPLEGRAGFRLMTYNIFGRNFEMESVRASIDEADPDIIAFQEFFTEQRLRLDPLLLDEYPYSFHCQGAYATAKRANIGLYSKHPFTMDAADACGSDDGRVARIFALFEMPGVTPFTVGTTHLDWPVQISVIRRDANLLENIAAMNARQQGQFADLLSATENVEGPFLLAGDFNSTSWSYALRSFAQSARFTRETRNLFTFPKLWHIRGAWRPLPAFLPLDHIMSREGIQVHNVFTGPASGSDHLPVIADFSVPTQRPASQ